MGRGENKDFLTGNTWACVPSHDYKRTSRRGVFSILGGRGPGVEGSLRYALRTWGRSHRKLHTKSL